MIKQGTRYAGFAVLIGAIFFAVVVQTRSYGRVAMTDLAKRNGACRPNDCSSGLALMNRFFHEEYGINPSLVEWCVGTYTWAGMGVGRLAIITLPKQLIVTGMRAPCGTLFRGSLPT